MPNSRALLRLVARPDLVLEARGRPTPLGRWLLERVASVRLDWPAVGFHWVELTPRGLEVLLIAGSHANHSVQFATIARVMARETALAAARQHWVRGPLWAEVEVIEPGRRRVGWTSVPSLRSG